MMKQCFIFTFFLILFQVMMIGEFLLSKKLQRWGNLWEIGIKYLVN